MNFPVPALIKLLSSLAALFAVGYLYIERGGPVPFLVLFAALVWVNWNTIVLVRELGEYVEES